VGKGLEEGYTCSLASAADFCEFALHPPSSPKGMLGPELKAVALLGPRSSPSLSHSCQEPAEIHLWDRSQSGLVNLKLIKYKS